MALGRTGSLLGLNHLVAHVAIAIGKEMKLPTQNKHESYKNKQKTQNKLQKCFIRELDWKLFFSFCNMGPAFAEVPKGDGLGVFWNCLDSFDL